MNQEILIIGGGVIGLSLARELHRRGMRSITIVDRGPIGCEASWAAAGMLAPNIEAETDTDFHRFGIESLEIYPDFSDALLEDTGIDIELDRSGTLCLAFDDAEAAELTQTFHRQTDLGVTLEHLSSSAISAVEPSISIEARAGLFYPNDWQVENRKMMSALQTFSEIRGI